MSAPTVSLRLSAHARLSAAANGIETGLVAFHGATVGRGLLGLARHDVAASYPPDTILGLTLGEVTTLIEHRFAELLILLEHEERQ